MDMATARNMLCAALLSLTTTFLLAMLYLLVPLIIFVLSAFLSSSGTMGIGARAGGVSLPGFRILIPISLVLFLIIFRLLQKEQVKR